MRFIDSFRLRRDDDYAFGAEICEFYALGNAIPGFKDYLNQAKAKNVGHRALETMFRQLV